MSDLDKLIEAVEAGSDEFEMFCPLFHASGLCVEADGAYAGSLDAAKALHEALLPEQEYKIGLDVAQVYPAGKISSSIWGYTIENPNPARAWLIAILKAYRAKDQTDD